MLLQHLWFPDTFTTRYAQRSTSLKYQGDLFLSASPCIYPVSQMEGIFIFLILWIEMYYICIYWNLSPREIKVWYRLRGQVYTPGPFPKSRYARRESNAYIIYINLRGLTYDFTIFKPHFKFLQRVRLIGINSVGFGKYVNESRNKRYTIRNGTS